MDHWNARRRLTRRSSGPPPTKASSGAYTDCYAVVVPRTVTQAEYVEAFYTTAVFKLERWLIARFLSRPSTDAQALQLARGSLSAFAAWSVEQRKPDQLVLAAGRTRSWLMAVALPAPGPTGTKLYFGSQSFRVGAVVPPARPWGGSSGLFSASTSCTLGCCSARPLAGRVPTRRSVLTAAHVGPDLYLDLEAREHVPREEAMNAWNLAYAELESSLAERGSAGTLFVVCGRQGAGKSTWIRRQLAEPSPCTPAARHAGASQGVHPGRPPVCPQCTPLVCLPGRHPAL